MVVQSHKAKSSAPMATGSTTSRSENPPAPIAEEFPTVKHLQQSELTVDDRSRRSSAWCKMQSTLSCVRAQLNVPASRVFVALTKRRRAHGHRQRRDFHEARQHEPDARVAH